MFAKRLRFVLAGASVSLISFSCTGSGGDSDSSNANVIQNRGSDTMVNLAQTWAEAYAKVKPEVSVEVSGGGSSVGIRDLIQGIVDLANASRKLKESERAQVVQNTGKEPLEHVVAYDGIGIYVHKDNPLETITLAQLAGIYKKDGEITKWSQLGVDHSAFCESDEIVCFSRQSNSGTYVFFREAVLGKGDFRLGTKDMHGSKDVVDAVASTPCGIGYSGMGYKTEEVRFVNVAKSDGADAFVPNAENVLSGDYPIARPLQIYTIGEATGPTKEYLEWIKSPAGQKIVRDEGYVPLASE